MSSRPLHIVLLAVMLALGGLASAPAVRAEPDAPPISPATLAYDFEDELVTGDLVSAFGEQLVVRRRGTRASLIELRTSYVDKLVQSVEDL